jgi:hypothetical protein
MINVLSTSFLNADSEITGHVEYLFILRNYSHACCVYLTVLCCGLAASSSIHSYPMPEDTFLKLFKIIERFHGVTTTEFYCCICNMVYHTFPLHLRLTQVVSAFLM